MSRIQTRISDLGASEIRRPTVSHIGEGWRCEFHLRGTSVPNAPLTKLSSPDRTKPEIQVLAGSLFECQYRLVRNEGSFGRFAVHSKASYPPEGFEPGRGKSLMASAVAATEDDSIRAVEHSLLWQTTGKGERDFGIHLFERRKVKSAKDGQTEPFLGIHAPAVFKTLSPLAPLSYQGQLISIDWLVRVRVFLQSGRELHFEQPFMLVVDDLS